MEIRVSQLLSLIHLVAKPNVDCTWLVFNSTYQYYDFLKISMAGWNSLGIRTKFQDQTLDRQSQNQTEKFGTRNLWHAMLRLLKFIDLTYPNCRKVNLNLGAFKTAEKPRRFTANQSPFQTGDNFALSLGIHASLIFIQVHPRPHQDVWVPSCQIG